jgi:hypothetical protein
MRQGKDQMKITAGQQFSFTIIEPAFLEQCLTFRTMSITAGVVGYALKRTVIALLKMAA